jgi:isopentenyl phosphate kinase
MDVSALGRELTFLKLGGSLITDKHKPRSARPEVINRIAREIKSVCDANPALQLIIGHGSGSFGHYSGNIHKTRAGVSTPEEWAGFAEVWYDAALLNQLVMRSLHDAGIPALAFPPSASAYADNGRISTWDLAPILTALEQGLLPVVYGDVVFDSSIGGTILSTEDLFVQLAREFNPSRILLAGQDPGVWKDFPKCTALFERITPADRGQLGSSVSQSSATDVTGGMADKVDQMLVLIDELPGLECLIFSGEEPGRIRQALAGAQQGTLLSR